MVLLHTKFNKMNTITDSALVLFSGGQDSSTCLAWALNRYSYVETIGFFYGQTHHIEMNARQTVLNNIQEKFPIWKNHLGEDHILDINVLGQISDTALTRHTDISTNHSGLPNTFVPGRNLLFLTLASALAYKRGHSIIIGGMCETDYSGYPDCRQETIQAQQTAINLGMNCKFIFEMPLMHLNKAQIWDLSFKLGGQVLVDLILEDSHTCYKGIRGKSKQRHIWGYGCGSCPACILRANGFKNWQKILS